MLPMQATGFQYFSRQTPNHLALAAPDGRHWSRGELRAECKRLARQQRAARLAGREGLLAPPSDGAGLIATALTFEPGYPAIPGLDPVHATSQAMARMQSLGMEPEQGNVHYCISPQQGDESLAWALACLHYGHAVVLADHWSARAMVRDIERYRVSTSYLTAGQCSELLALLESVGSCHDTSSVRHLVYRDAGCPPALPQSIAHWRDLVVPGTVRARPPRSPGSAIFQPFFLPMRANGSRKPGP